MVVKEGNETSAKNHSRLDLKKTLRTVDSQNIDDYQVREKENLSYIYFTKLLVYRK